MMLPFKKSVFFHPTKSTSGKHLDIVCSMSRGRIIFVCNSICKIKSYWISISIGKIS